MNHKKDVLIIGGGVVGICSAYYLARQGRQVTVIEAGDICSGASYGNAGLLLLSHIVPLAAPGVLGQGLKWLLNPESPFYIKPRVSLELASWLWRFRAACSRTRALNAMPLLQELVVRSMALYQEMASTEKFEFGFETKGQLKLFNTHRGFQSAQAEVGHLARFGIESEALLPDEIRRLEPSIRRNVVGGILVPKDAHLNPSEFVVQLAKLVKASGVDIRTSTEALGFRADGSKVMAVETTRGDFYPEQIVLAGGAWSPRLTASLGLRLPIQAAKGYSVTLKRGPDSPVRPLMLGEAKVAVTPYRDTIRFGGTLELCGLDPTVTRRRQRAIMQSTREYISGTEDLEVIEIWRGFRPCLPDGLPVIGYTARYKNLIIAAGHGMIGMAHGPVTGKLVADLACHHKTEFNIDPLRLERFC